MSRQLALLFIFNFLRLICDKGPVLSATPPEYGIESLPSTVEDEQDNDLYQRIQDPTRPSFSGLPRSVCPLAPP
jgi:hypothetical protein